MVAINLASGLSGHGMVSFRATFIQVGSISSIGRIMLEPSSNKCTHECSDNTMSQLGYMMLALGIGSYQAALLAHDSTLIVMLDKRT